jgi:hypothetical protein
MLNKLIHYTSCTTIVTISPLPLSIEPTPSISIVNSSSSEKLEEATTGGIDADNEVFVDVSIVNFVDNIVEPFLFMSTVKELPDGAVKREALTPCIVPAKGILFIGSGIQGCKSRDKIRTSKIQGDFSCCSTTSVNC